MHCARHPKNVQQGLPTDYASLPLPNETRHYVPKLLAIRNIVRNPEQHGIAIDTLPNEPYFGQVTVHANMDIQSAARLANMSSDEFLALNAAFPRKLIRSRTPVNLLVPVDKADRFHVDVPLEEADAGHYDALLLPGGVANPDQLRTQPKAVQFVKQFVEAGKPVGVICHGPWTLIEAGVVKGRTLTSWPSLRTDLINAGARWVDEEVVTDRGLVSSRKPSDIPAFTRKLIEEIEEGSHAGRAPRPEQEQRARR